MSDPDPTKPDLSLVDTDQLIEELSKRFDSILIARERHPTGEEHEAWFDYSGGVSAAIGLAVRAKRKLLTGLK